MPEKIRIEGNRGGDYLEISPLQDNMLHLEVGHCCVRVIHMDVPVELLTMVLAQVAEYGVVGTLVNSSWPRDFIEQLIGDLTFYD